MKKYIFPIAVLFIFATGCAQKKKVEQKNAEVKASAEHNAKEAKQAKLSEKAYKCVVQKDTRLVVLDKDTKRCEIHYTKFGEKAQVAWAEATPSICTDVFARIRNNIESKGFKCEAINEDTAQQAQETAKRDAASLKK